MKFKRYLMEATAYEKMVQFGDDRKKLDWLKDQWAKINRKYFKGRLKAPHITIQTITRYPFIQRFSMHRRTRLSIY